MIPSFSRHNFNNVSCSATILGIGTAPLGNMFATISEQDAWQCLEQAWVDGVRVFDTAPFYGYGLAERRLGDFLRTKPRDEFVLSTKVGRLLAPRRDSKPTDTFFLSNMPFNPVYDYSYAGALRSYEDSLQRLGLDRIDILLIHDTGVAEHGADQPRMFEQAMEGSAKALRELREQQVVGSIGMGLNEWEVAEAGLQRVDFDTFLLAGRYTLLEQLSAKSFLPLCAQKGVKLMLGGVFNSGILVSDDTESATWNYATAPRDKIDRALQLKSICARHEVPLPAAALQFAAAHPQVATVLVGTRHASENAASAQWLQLPIPVGMWTDLRDEGLIAADAPLPATDPA